MSLAGNSLKASYGEKLAIADRDETSGERSIGTDQRHERLHLLRMGRHVVDHQQSPRPQYAPEVRPPRGIFLTLGIKKDEDRRKAWAELSSTRPASSCTIEM